MSLATLLITCVAPVARALAADRPKQVLVLNSTRRDEQFSVVADREVPKLLAQGLEEGVDYYTEYFDFLRFPHYETVNFHLLREKYRRRRFDLLVLMGDVAIDFMAKYRKVLFTGTPAVFYALNPQRGRMANSTGLTNQLHFNRSIDLAMALQPDLKHVYVVSGAGMADRSFENQANVEFRPFEERLEFTYLSGLVTKDLETRLRTLPEHSAVFYVSVSEDGAGAHFQQMEYLSRVAAAANAPTYSWADAGVDSGIVGGSRRDHIAETRAIATLGLRVLHGERAADIPLSSANLDVAQVDWRQLRRWGLAESRLPAGSTVLFREPDMWDQYRQYIIGATILMFAQAALIAGLLVQRNQRQRVEVDLRGSQAKLRDSYDRIRHLGRRLLGEQEAERARVARDLHDDISQQLVMLSVELDTLRSNHLPADSAKLLSRALEATQGISTSVRDLSHRLHPGRLRLIGLVAALDSLRRDFSLPHLPIAYCHRRVPDEIDHDVALCLFRVAQEALANAIKHSDAHHILLDLSGGPSNLMLTIVDDGKGFDPEDVTHAGLGLVSMRERLESIGGALDIHAMAASGTRLRATVPIPPAGTVRVGAASS